MHEKGLLIDLIELYSVAQVSRFISVLVSCRLKGRVSSAESSFHWRNTL